MATEDASESQIHTIGEAAESLWDATRRFQDLLDELEDERLGKWAAYTAFRDVGAIFRGAIEQLRIEEPVPELAEILGAYRAGAHAGLEAAADLAEAVKDGGIESIDLGIQRLAIASQQFVRGRHLLQQYLEQSEPAGDGDGGSA